MALLGQGIDEIAQELSTKLCDPNSLPFYRMVARNISHPVIEMLLGATLETAREGYILKNKGACFVAFMKDWGDLQYGDRKPWKTSMNERR